jgi:hypothetical protein
MLVLVCMFACTYIYIYIYVYTCMYVYMHVPVWKCIFCVYAYIYLCVYVRMHIFIYVPVCGCVYRCYNYVYTVVLASSCFSVPIQPSCPLLYTERQNSSLTKPLTNPKQSLDNAEGFPCTNTVISWPCCYVRSQCQYSEPQD